MTTDCPGRSQSIPPPSSTTRRIAASAFAGSAFSTTAAMPFLPVPALVDFISASWPAPAIRGGHCIGWGALFPWQKRNFFPLPQGQGA